jgi:hypothetical protein
MAAGAFATQLGLAWVWELGFPPGYYTNPGKLGTQRTKKINKAKLLKHQQHFFLRT